MKWGSLFTGIRGLDIAVEALGGEVVWHAEIDPDASKELERQRPGVPNHGDVTTIDYSKVEPVDGLIGGGWPCQPFSSAGGRKGTEDPRYLWPEVARALRALRPHHFVMEQVSDILDERRFPGVFSRCLADLAEAGMHARWGCLRSADVGAPHGRRRLFLAAHREGIGWGDREVHASANGGQPATDTQGGRPQEQQGTERGRDPLQRTQRLQSDGLRHRPSADTNGAGLQGNGRAEPEGFSFAAAGSGFDWRIGDKDYGPAIRRWEAIVGPAPVPAVMVKGRDGVAKPRLNPAFSAWMMGLEVPRLSRRAALRCIGNAVNPLQAYVALSQLARVA